MNEKSSRPETPTPDVEKKQIKTKTLGEGVSTGWENERRFTAEELMAAIKEIDPKAGDVEMTDQLVSYEGVLLSASFRAPESATGYSFMMKGNHGKSFRKRTVIDRIDYAGPNSEDVEYAEEIAEYKNDAWVKS